MTAAQHRAVVRRWQDRLVTREKLLRDATSLTRPLRKRQVAKAKRVINRHKRGAIGAGRSEAIKWARAQLGTTENPPGSNRGGKITIWQKGLATWLVGQPWCGVFVGTSAKEAGVKGITSRVASVALIEADSKAGKHGYSHAVPVSVDTIRPGDHVILFGPGVHVELVEKVHKRTRVIQTIGGNTSAGNAGSQSNGGGVFRRYRPIGDVYAAARPDYLSL